MTVNARTEEFQQLELFGKYALFTNGRIDRPTVPKGGIAMISAVRTMTLASCAISKKVWRSTMQARS